MKKLISLRQHLIDACPELQRDPDNLRTHIDSGSIRYHVRDEPTGANLSHRYDCTAQIIVLDFGADVDQIVLPLLHWLSLYQPDAPPDEAVRFESEILKNDKVDFSLSVQLTERVTVTVNDQGHYNAEHHEDARPIDPYGPTDWALLADDVHGQDTG